MLGTAAAIAATPVLAELPDFSGAPRTNFQQLKIGGGGYVTGIDISPDGLTKVVNTDCAMAYVWNSGTSTWDQLVTQDTMQNVLLDFGWALSHGNLNHLQQNNSASGLLPAGLCYEIAVAHSASNIIYMKYNSKVFKSTNRGATWARTNYNILPTSSPSTAPTSTLYFSSIPEWLTNAKTNSGVRVRNLSNVSSIAELYDSGVASIDTGANTVTIGGGGSGIITAIPINSLIAFTYLEDFPSRTAGRKMAVDPNNANIVWVGSTVAGLQYTTDGGTTWNTVPNAKIPTVTYGYYLIAIDPSNSNYVYVFAVGSSGNRLFSGFSGHGGGTSMYYSTDAGATFTATRSGPIAAAHLVVASNTGVVWATGVDGKLWKYIRDINTWTAVLTNAQTSGNGYGGYWSVCFDPAYNDDSRMVAVCQDGALNRSINAGANWGGLVALPGISRSSGDVPWMARTYQDYLALGDATYDPSQPHTILCTDGIGVWSTTGPTSSNAAAMANWTPVTNGIENLQAYAIRCPQGSKPVAFVGDRSVFQLDTSNNVNQTTCSRWSQGQQLVNGAAGDYAAGTPSFMAGIFSYFQGYSFNYSGYSTDYGANWLPFNRWNRIVYCTALSRTGGSGYDRDWVKIDLSSVGGYGDLVSWSGGTGDIVTIFSLTGTGYAPFAGGSNSKALHYPVRTLGDGNTIQLQFSQWSQVRNIVFPNATGGYYLLYVDTNPKTSWSGTIDVKGTYDSGVANGYGTGNMIRMAVGGTVSNWASSNPITISGATGATDINGDWMIGGNDGQTYIDLKGSTWNNNTWTGGGKVISSPLLNSGSIAVSSPSKILMMAGSSAYGDPPYYTNDGGKTWTPLPIPLGSNGGTFYTNADANVGDTKLYFSAAPAIKDKLTTCAIVRGLWGNIHRGSPNNVISTSDATTITLSGPVYGAIPVGEEIQVYNGSTLVTTLYTSAPTAFNGTMLTFSSVSALTPGWTVRDVPNNPFSNGNTVIAHDATSITLNKALTYAIPSGTPITFFQLGWPQAPTANTFRVGADRVTDDVFYVFNAVFGLYKVVGGIATLVNSGTGTSIPANDFVYNSNYGCMLKTVPGNSGHLFWTSNILAGGYDMRLWRSVDGGTSMYTVRGFYSIEAYGFGAIKPGKSYPTIYVAGFYDSSPAASAANAQWGIWRSDDDSNAGRGGWNAAATVPNTDNTWTQVGTTVTGDNGGYINGIYNFITDIDGDPVTWGKFYVTTWTGVMMGQVSA